MFMQLRSADDREASGRDWVRVLMECDEVDSFTE